nr:MAG TPA: Repressor protein CI [Caudoviricetes sp.]
MSFSTRLQQAMDDKQIRPAELSRMTGIGEGAISQYRKGAYKAGQRNLEKLATALGVSIQWLMGMDSSDDSSADTNKTSPAEIDEGLLDEQLIDRLCRLSPEELAKVDAFVQGLLANH